MIIYAVNVNTGGGKVLLDRLLVQNPFESTSIALLDSRYQVPLEYQGKKFYFSILSRLFAENKLHKEIKSIARDESVLFFGNLPPFRMPKIKSYLYLQNCYLTRQVPLPTDSLRELVRSWAESWILKLFYKNVDEIWVQTDWMKDLTLKQCPKADIKIKSFLPILPLPTPQLVKKYSFLYVGSLSANKGLPLFLDALQDLDNSLQSTIEACIVLNNKVDDSPRLASFAKKLRNISLCVKYKANREELFQIYEDSEHLIITSLYESFYLPAYEAYHFGCKIIARDDISYLHDSKIKDIRFVPVKNFKLHNFLEPKFTK